MNKVVVGILIIAVLIAGVYVAYSSVGTTGNAVLGVSDVKTFVVTGDHLRFFIDGVENPDIRVRQGDVVRIQFTSTEGFHDWKVDEFNAATEKVRGETMTSVEFVADQRGIFEYYCSVGQHRVQGMKGRFIVE